MARFRPTLTYEVDWGNDASFSHAESDVTPAVDNDLRALFGAAKVSNPDRPVIRPLTGSVTLMGDVYAPRASTVFTPAQLRQRRRFRVQWSDGTNTVTLIQCWIQNPKIIEPRAGTKRTRYSLEGYLLQPMRRQVMLAQLANNATTLSARTMVESAFGQTLDSFVLTPIDLTIFQFEGTAGEFASRYSTIAGTFPMERANGRLGLFGPLQHPANRTAIMTPDYIISNLESEWGEEHIRNYADVTFYNPEIDRVKFRESREYVGNGGNAIPQITIRLPPLQTGQRYDNIAVTIGREAVVVLVDFRAWTQVNHQNVTVYRKVWTYEWLVESSPSALTAAVASMEDIGTGETVVTITFSNWNTARQWSWSQDIDIAAGSGMPNETGTHDRTSSNYQDPITGLSFSEVTTVQADGLVSAADVAGFQWLRGRRLAYEFSFDVVTNAPAGPSSSLVIQNLQSQAEWETREAKFPGWFAFGAVGAVTTRINELAEPRHIHTIDIPLAQRDEAKALIVAELDTGDYLELTVVDTIAGVSIHEAVMVMQVEYLLGNGRTDVKRLVVIETGNPLEANRLHLENNPLFLNNNPLFLLGPQPVGPPAGNLLYLGSTANRLYLGSVANPLFLEA